MEPDIVKEARSFAKAHRYIKAMQTLGLEVRLIAAPGPGHFDNWEDRHADAIFGRVTITKLGRTWAQVKCDGETFRAQPHGRAYIVVEGYEVTSC